jgi:HK97 family phage prohead protease
MNKKVLSTEITNAPGSGVDAIISTESIDRDGEVLVSDGMDTTEFDHNPIVFYNHDYAQPVGKVTNIRRRKNQIDATIEFAKRPDNFNGAYFPEFVKSLVEQGIVKGVSVGFVPKPGGVRKASKKDREDYGDNVRQVFSKWKLLEVSIAPLPANGQALVTAIQKGAVNSKQAERWLGYRPEKTIVVSVPRHGIADRLSTLHNKP